MFFCQNCRLCIIHRKSLQPAISRLSEKSANNLLPEFNLRKKTFDVCLGRNIEPSLRASRKLAPTKNVFPVTVRPTFFNPAVFKAFFLTRKSQKKSKQKRQKSLNFFTTLAHFAFLFRERNKGLFFLHLHPEIRERGYQSI